MTKRNSKPKSQASRQTPSVGGESPWGKIETVCAWPLGIVCVETASHGGVYVPPEANIQVPPALRQESGWYEEDCEVYIVAMTFDVPGIDFETACTHVRNWYPDAYEIATGEEVAPEQSHVRRKQLFATSARECFVGCSAKTSRPGWVQVFARRASDGASIEVEVTSEEYRSAPLGQYVVPFHRLPAN